MAVSKKKTFTLTFDLKASIMVEVKAENMEQALLMAKEYRPGDIYETSHDLNYDEMELTGVFC